MSSDEPRFVGLTPLVGVFDMPRSLAFYRDLLGFEVVAASPVVDAPEGLFSHWMWLRLGAAELMLNTQYDVGQRPDHPSHSRVAAHGDTCFYIGCSDIDAAYQQLTKRGLQAGPPRTAPYGLKYFVTKDPDGYAVVFQETRQQEPRQAVGQSDARKELGVSAGTH
jgi:catechol 2,3-dioxygenase-like lactoylglutathione lyase family enzyme